MAVVWGEAEVVLHTDGRSLPGEVEAATTVAAKQGAKTFGRVFRTEMRKALANSTRGIARSLGDLVTNVLLANGAMRRLYEGTIYARRGFQRLTTTVKTFSGNTLRRVTDGFRDFGTAIRTDAVRTMDMLREGAADLKINLQDVQETFPGLTRGVRAVANGFRYVRNEAAQFGTVLREDSIKTMNTLREGASHLKISLDDVRDTFPGLTRVVRGARSAFTRVGQEVKTLGPDMDLIRPAVERVRESFRSLSETLRGGRYIMRLWRTEQKNYIQESEEVARTTDKNEESQSRLHRTISRGVGGIRKYLSSWKSLPHGFRQAVFWTGLVIAAMGSLSVLTSALSGTIVALVTQIGALAGGIGFAVAGFAGLYAEGTKLTAGAQAAKDAFSALGEAFRQVRENITNNMFGGMADSINNITNTLLPALESNIASFAQTTGESLGRIFDALSSPSGIENFKALLDGFSPILESLTTAAITFGDAIADILVASLPTAQSFADAIANVGAQFSTWTSSEAGRARLAEFFATAERIMPMLVGLVVALGQALANLVTPTTITGVETFIQSLTDFMPVLGQIVGIIANLNIFGILAAALQLVGAALAPLIEPLSQFATILGQELITGIQELMPSVSALAAALAPILEIIIAIAVAALPPLIQILQSAIDYITMFAEAIIGADADSEEFKQAIEVMGQVVGTIFQVLANVITISLVAISGGLKLVAALLRGDFSGAFKAAEQIVRTVFQAMGWDFDAYMAAVEVMAREVTNFFRDINRAIESFGRTVSNIFSGVIGWIQDAVNWFGSLFGAANKASGAASAARGGGGGGSRAMASGGTLFGPTRILAGEAGPEAIVPLRRSLSQVDPSVRWLSAIAQGKMPAMASGGIVGGGRSMVIESGAIVVEDRSGDSRRTGNEVLQRIIERVG